MTVKKTDKSKDSKKNIKIPENPNMQSVIDGVINKQDINNLFILLVFIPVIGWGLLIIYFVYKACSIKDTLLLNNIQPIKRLNHLIWLWAVLTFFILLIVPVIYYIIRANQYANQWKIYKFTQH